MPDEAEHLAARLESVRGLIREIQPILQARRAQVGPYAQFMSFDLRPPVPDRNLDEFEAAHSLRLPLDYRGGVALARAR